MPFLTASDAIFAACAWSTGGVDGPRLSATAATIAATSATERAPIVMRCFRTKSPRRAAGGSTGTGGVSGSPPVALTPAMVLGPRLVQAIFTAGVQVVGSGAGQVPPRYPGFS